MPSCIEMAFFITLFYFLSLLILLTYRFAFRFALLLAKRLLLTGAYKKGFIWLLQLLRLLETNE